MGSTTTWTWLFFVTLGCTGAQYIVEVLEPARLGVRRTVQRCDATGANFGAEVVTFTFGAQATGCAVSLTPDNSCGPAKMNQVNDTMCLVNFGIVPRGNCSFSEKAYYAQAASRRGVDAVIIFNDEGKAPVEMAGGKYADKVRVPVLMVSYTCMIGMMERYSAAEGYAVQIKLSPGYYDLFRYLIPFVVVIGFCFVVLLASLLIRLCRERRRLARKRLSRRNLRKIPTKKFVNGDQPDACAICLDDFIEGEKLRVLPCRHMYHCKCIDPWLTKNRKVCPMCKRRVGAKNSDSESSGDERGRATTSTRRADDELPSTRAHPYRTLEEDPSTSSRTDVSASPTSQMMLTPSTSSRVLAVDPVQHSSTEHLVGTQTESLQQQPRPAALPESESEAASIYYTTDTEDEQEAEPVPAGSVTDTIRSALRSFVGRLGRSASASTGRLDHDVWEGVDNAAFEEQSRGGEAGGGPRRATRPVRIGRDVEAARERNYYELEEEEEGEDEEDYYDEHDDRDTLGLGSSSDSRRRPRGIMLTRSLPSHLLMPYTRPRPSPTTPTERPPAAPGGEQ